MKIYILGSDVKGWSIDHDRKYLKGFIKETGHVVTKNFLNAEVVQSVLWYQILEKRNFLLRFKKIIATASSFIKPDNPAFIKATKFVNLWIAPSRSQYEVFQKTDVNAAYQPFYVDEHVFRDLGKSRQALAELLKIDYEIVKDKFLIGSFQRDTLGTDLALPKWQKGPELLIEILSDLPDKDKWLLILTGPRRHYVVAECERQGIPYLFYGDKPVPGVDDISTAIQGLDTMALLYNLIDCYLVTSKSEGGPKAILEASFCKVMIFSTNVGLAPDILDKGSIYADSDCAVENIFNLIKGEASFYSELFDRNYRNAMNICSYEATKKRWKEIYAAFE